MRRTILVVLFLLLGAVVWKISTVEHWIIFNWVFLALLLLDFRKDQKDIDLLIFLPKGIALLFCLYYAYQHAPKLWYFLAKWEMSNVKHLFNWNDEFRSIPFNDGSLFRLYQPEWFTVFLRWVYGHGFSLALWAAVIRSLMTRDLAKMLRYVLSSHTMQLPIIVPFYTLVMLEEVWYVLGHPDGMARGFTDAQAKLWVMNCFPSMHTSVSFAILLLALREKGTIFRRLMVTYCGLVIFSTLYLEIHWVIDVIAGMALGYLTVKLVDVIYAFAARRMEQRKKAVEPVPVPTTASVQDTSNM